MKAKFAVSVVILALAYFCPAKAQQTTKAIPRIGFISSTGSAEKPSRLFEAFRQGLRDLDYVDGKTIIIVHRFAEGRLDRMPPFVHEFVQQKVDVIVGVNNVVIRAAKEATKTIPIVMISSVDPVAAGYVESFARPGRNITGLSWLSRDLSAKRLELLKDVFPKLTRAAILWDADGPGPAVAFKEYTVAARAFKLDLESLAVRGPDPDLTGAFEAARIARTEALIVVGNPLMSQNLKSIFALATKHRLPSMTEEDRYVTAGGLMSYGANLASFFRRAATYVDAILKGAKPANLLVEQPKEFELFINQKTAQQLGVEIPTRVLIRANEVIE
jgi:putative ABC transport system substrate-binding protein